MLTIFDMLTQKHLSVYDEHAILQSIKNHLQSLLNSRRGSLVHMPDYGLSDLGFIYQNLPQSGQQLCHEIKTLIEKYEPRLCDIKVQCLEADADAVIAISIYAQIRNSSNSQFLTTFQADQRAVIECL